MRHTAIYLACAFLICIPAISPLLVDSLTCGYDNVFHLWRAVQVEHLMEQGVAFSRWAPDMAHGFGFPLFVFVSPVSAYGAALLHQTGITWALALNLAFALGIVMGGLFVFLLGRDLFGPAAGLVATAAYAYAPYQAYEAFNRGSLWEAVAWAFPPLVLWGLHRWVSRAERRFLLIGATALGALILTHQLFAFLFAPLLGAWVVAAAITARDKGALFRGIGLGLLGLGLAAFYWLPGLVERNLVQTDRLLGTWVFDYRHNFISIGELLAPPRIADPAMVNDWPPKTLGMVPALLALLPLARWRWLDRSARWQTAVLWIVLAVLAAMTLALSRVLWDHLPLLEYVQFPWRFLGPAVLCISLLAGAAVAGATHPAPRPVTWGLRYGPAVIVPVLWITSVGWFSPRYCNLPRDTSVAGMIAWERATDTIGSTAKGEYLPVWVDRFPKSSQIQEAYAQGEPVARLDAESLPNGARVSAAEYGPVDATIELTTPEPFRARYLAIYYPGWRATVDGTPVPVEPTHPDGLTSFDVPAGSHTVRVEFGETPVRWIGNAVSLLCVAATVGAARFWPSSSWRLRGEGQGERGRSASGGDRSLWAAPVATAGHAWAMFAVCGLLVIARLGIYDRAATPLNRTRLIGQQLEGVDHPTAIQFGDEFILLGYDALPTRVSSGERFEVTTYWQSPQPGGPDYGVALRVVDPNGGRWDGGDLRNPRWHRTPPPVTEWAPDEYASIALSVPLLMGTPPGTYTVEAIAFDRQTLLPLTAHDDAEVVLGPALELGTIRVAAPRRPPQPDEMGLAGQETASMGPLTLLYAHMDRAEAVPGDPVLLSVLWRADEAPDEDLGLIVNVRAPGGALAAEFRVAPTVVWHPTSEWRKGDVWLGQHQLRLPADLEDGPHEWSLQLCTGVDDPCTPLGPSVAVARLSVNSPDRIYTPPPMNVEADAVIGGMTTLLGAFISPYPGRLEPGAALAVTLVWRSDAPFDGSYRVYLHLLGPDGAPIAQSDGEPVNWTRPTTGWAIGEVIVDQRVVEIPEATAPGEYVLRAGLYTTESGRLLTQDGEDGVTLGMVSIGVDP